MTIPSVLDYTGDGAAHTISSIIGVSGKAATWFQITYLSGSGTARIGDANISAGVASPYTPGQGIPLPSGAGNGQFIPPVAQAFNPYHFDDIYLLVPNGDIVSIGYAI